MHITFYDHEGLIHDNVVPAEQTVNETITWSFFVNFSMQHPQEETPASGKRCHHSTGQCLTTRESRSLGNSGLLGVGEAATSGLLLGCHHVTVSYEVYPKVKKERLRGKHFENVETANAAYSASLLRVAKDGLEGWHHGPVHCWQKRLKVEGAYVE